jgi:D-alanyl-D-alanine carboxypeptidase
VLPPRGSGHGGHPVPPRSASAAPGRTIGSAALAALLLVVLLAIAACSSPAAPTPTGATTSAPGPTPTALPWPAAADATLPAEAGAAMQAEMARWVEKGFLPGVTAAVVTPQGSWSGSAGVDGNGTELAPDAGMAIASITKTMTAAEVMLLAEQGKVDLDEQASTYLQVRQVANGVTLRQLLGHRSSVPASDDRLWEQVFASPDAHWTADQVLTHVPEATREPGRGFAYDNTNFILLGRVVEEVTGRSVGESLRSDLWQPLGLTRIAFQDEQRLTAPLAAPGGDDGVPANGDTQYLPFRSVASVVGAAGGVAADAESVARWGYQLYGGRLLSPESVTQMTTFDDGDAYGLGTLDFTHPSQQTSHIDGFGHPGELPGFRTVLAVLPGYRTAIALMTPSAVEVVGYVQWLVKAGSLRG